MLYPVKLKCYYFLENDEIFLEWLQSSFSNLFDLILVKGTVTNNQVGHYISLNKNQQLLLYSANQEILLNIPEDFSDNASFILQLSQQLTQFYQVLNTYPDKHPMKLTFFDENGQVVYDNKGFDGNFFSFNQEAQLLEDWIQEKIKNDTKHHLTLTVPSPSFDHILIQDYRGLYDQDGNFFGTFSQVIDLKPLLEAYLEDSGQALVGWSDTTSGASITNNLFED
ncbi:hypothetical protein [Streptococcus pluranimalium]|uniref:Na+ driven multidrug efflux pump n=1 Tax=Streptococcus pluranimalium TaxID=82348 RepID=A0A2L0D3S8_9STRE|nr:hypothetical protein [Streptococcus pluranimalium]AUW96465.1 hypothetical protein C0J00_04745 [Streptococcus pluranimalium]